MLLAISLFILAVGLGRWGLRWVPLPGDLFEPPKPAWEFLDRQGRSLREVSEEDLVTHRVPFQQISPALITATMAAEDQRFWTHGGVDWRASLRAAVSLVRHRRIISGGSTITQQLIKMAQPRPRTFRTKIIETLQAMRLEQVWSKERILSEYLNRLDYGNLRRGCGSAAQFYFDRPVRELSTAQAAFLAGLPQAPSRLNPHRRFDRAKKRQEWILSRLQTIGYLDAAAYRRAVWEPILLAAPQHVFKAPHFVDLLLQQPDALRRIAAGGPVRTTLDLELNRMVEGFLRSQLARLDRHHVRNGAVVVIENRTGEVLALVGSEDYFAPIGGQVNGAWAARSAGSTFKPFTFLVAFETGATPATIVADVPTEFPTPTGIYAPVNYNRHCYGPVRYRLALANSLNIPAVKVLHTIGGAQVLLERLQACGLTTLTGTADHYGLGLTIGNAEARLLELANAYACLARLGLFKPYRLLADDPLSTTRLSYGTKAPRTSQVFDSGAAYLIADILSDNTARHLAFGLDSPLSFDFPVACKTGTSTDFRDNWALGYTPEFTVGIWVGNFDGSPMEQVSGVSGAAPILHAVFEYLHAHYQTGWFARPPEIVQASVHPLTGKRLNQPHGGIREKFLSRYLPPTEATTDYDAAGRVRLSSEYQSWIHTSDNWLAGQISTESDPRNPRPGENPSGNFLRVLMPLPGAVFFLDPDLPDQGRRLRLRSTGGASVAWSSPSLVIETNSWGICTLLAPGHHEITALEADTGARASTQIQVRWR